MSHRVYILQVAELKDRHRWNQVRDPEIFAEPAYLLLLVRSVRHLVHGLQLTAILLYQTNKSH